VLRGTVGMEEEREDMFNESSVWSRAARKSERLDRELELISRHTQPLVGNSRNRWPSSLLEHIPRI
jgi:hypothetical protein